MAKVTPRKLHDIRYIRICMLITAVLSFADLSVLLKNPSKVKIYNIFRQIYGAILLCAMPILDSYQIYIKKQMFDSFFLSSIDVIARISVTCFIVTAIFNFTFYKHEDFKKFLKLLLAIDRMYAKYVAFEQRHIHLWLEILFIHVYFGCAYFLEEYQFCLSNIGGYYKYYTIENVERYAIGIFIILTRHMMKAIQERVYFLNVLIEKSVVNFCKGEAFINRTFNEDIGDLKVSQNILLKLCEAVNYFNSIFGWPIMVFTLYMLISVLRSFNHLVRWYFNPPLKFEREYQDFDNFYLLSNGIWSAYSLLIGVTLITAADQASSEIICTTRLCYRFIQDVDSCHQASQKPAFRKVLLMLAARSNKSKFYFKAAGFFKLNNSILFAFMHIVVTYIIFIAQIQKQ